MKVRIISTVNKIPDPKVAALTDRAIESCQNVGLEWEIFDPVIPSEMEELWNLPPISQGWIDSIEAKYTRKYPGLDWEYMWKLKATVSLSHHFARQVDEQTLIMEQDAVLLHRLKDFYATGWIHNLQDKPWRYSCYVTDPIASKAWEQAHIDNGEYWCEDSNYFRQHLPKFFSNTGGASGGNEAENSQIMRMVRE